MVTSRLMVMHLKYEQSGTMCGTPNYMSPEVISSAPHGLASDVWSLGCLLYTMLVGVPPFESHSVEETLRRIANVKYSVPDHVSPAAADLISQLLVRYMLRLTRPFVYLTLFFLADTTRYVIILRHCVRAPQKRRLKHARRTRV